MVEGALVEDKELLLSSYVLMEFKRTVITDCIFLRRLVLEEESLADVFYRLRRMAEISPENKRIVDRCSKILASLRDENRSKILVKLENYIKWDLIAYFLEGLKVIESETKCTAAGKNPKKYHSGYILQINCDTEKCEIIQCLSNHSQSLKELLSEIDSIKEDYFIKLKKIILDFPRCFNTPVDTCKIMGDVVISIDTPRDAELFTSDHHMEVICPVFRKNFRIIR